ncbi:transcription initiation at TATA-containing promoter protein [Vanrija albida]|uniref:Transcription initiation at TATA-containing promoter protein n=1 Tax=Vanrija albida TaxID=181172 RepID=A0ABR3QC37_9TREE
MDVDADGEEDGGPNGAGVKRAGDDLVGGDAKRVNLGDSTPSAQAPGVDGAPVDPNAPPVVYPWTTYVEPAPRNPGPTTPLTQGQHKHLLSTVRSLLKSNNSFNFREPVDTVRFNIPHYHQIIDYPMDLGTIETKLIASDPRGPPKDKSKAAKWDPSKGTYTSVSQVSKDVRQIWENTRKFNGRDHVVSQAAGKLDDQWEKALRTLPADIPPPPAASASPAGPSTTPSRRQSISQTPTIRRDADSARPKREIHPPPSKDLGYEPGSQRKPKRRNDPQLQWAQRTITGFEKSQKYFEIVSPFLYPVSEIITAIPVYKEIIKKPIDLLLIKARLEDNIYEDVTQVDADIRLLVSNATTFNPPGDAVHNGANALLQLWEERYRTMPPKQEPREPSEEVIVEEDESDTEDKDTIRLKEAKAERAILDREIADLEAKIARRPPKRKPKPQKPVKAQRKYSTTSKASPGANGHSAPKKPRKQKEVPAYREDADSEEELQSITIQQKQELAEKIQVAEADILSQAVQIIQASTQISGDQEIELDIDSLPNATVLKLYNLVCRGRKGRGKKNKVQPRKSGFGGAPGRKHLNEQEEADRIAKMEAQLQSFEGRSSAAHAGYDEESSSEEESSDEE